MLTDAQMAELERNLRHEVKARAENAVAWYFTAETDHASVRLRALIQGIEDEDPVIMEFLPFVDWSGQWAEGPDWDATFADALWDAIDHRGSWDEELPEDWQALSDDLFHSIGQDYADECIMAEVERIIAYHLD